MLKGYLAVMVVGAVGCAARMWLSNFLAQKYGPAFPIGTLVVNILGCFIIGVFAAMTRPDGGLLVHPVIRQAVMIGFLGGFTTFSSFGLQTMALFSDGEWGYATLNIVLSVVLCLVAVWDRSSDRTASRPRMKELSHLSSCSKPFSSNGTSGGRTPVKNLYR